MKKVILIFMTLSLVWMTAFVECNLVIAKDNVSVVAVLKNTPNGLKYVRKNNRNKYILVNNSLCKASTALPNRYSLLDEISMPEVRDQGDTSTCWAHAALASYETNLIKKGLADNNIDLSEWHLSYFAYTGANDDKDKSKYAGRDAFIRNEEVVVWDEGGGIDVAEATLARWYGALDHKYLPYETFPTNISMDMQTYSNSHIKAGIHFEDPVKRNDKEKFVGLNPVGIKQIKEAIIKYGAVDIGFYTFDEDDEKDQKEDPYSNEEISAIYTWKDKEANHDVVIVGWDNDYSRTNFSNKGGKLPPKNGAWIIRNSWGKECGEDGYYYVSYYDKSLAGPAVVVADDETYSSNIEDLSRHTIYQYDGVSYGDSILDSKEKIFGVNNFIARGTEKITHLGLYFMDNDTKINVAIYKNIKKNKFTKDNKVFEGTWKRQNYGYYKVPLKREVVVNKGDKLSVMISASFKDGKKTYWYYPFELKNINKPSDSYVDIDVQKGQTYMKKGKGSWVDVTRSKKVKGYKIGNALVKLMGMKSE